MHPPHLPPKLPNTQLDLMWKRLKSLSFIVFFGLVAGITGASLVLAFWPTFIGSEVSITQNTHFGSSVTQLDNGAGEGAAARIVSVHKGLSSLNGANYLNKKIGDGIMLGSDGWIALYQPNYDGNYKNIYVVTADEQVLQAENALLDKYSGVLYVKVGIKDGQFKPANFNNQDTPTGDIFVFHNSNWSHGSILYPSFSYQIPHLDSAPWVTYSLDGSFDVGDVAINSQGQILGFITEKNLLLPIFYVQRVQEKVLSQQALSYPSLGVNGWFSEEQAIISENTKKNGFLVAEVWSASSPLRRGDVIFQVNGEPLNVANSANLWYTLDKNQSVELEVLRGGKTLTLTVKVVQTK